MTYTNDQLVNEFYKTLPEDLRNKIPLPEVDRVCKSPFHYARYNMKRSILNSLRIKHFATFVLYPNKILKLLEANDYNLKYGAITKATHRAAKEHLLQIYAEAISVKNTSKWGIGIDLIDTSEESQQDEPTTTEA